MLFYFNFHGNCLCLSVLQCYFCFDRDGSLLLCCNLSVFIYCCNRLFTRCICNLFYIIQIKLTA